MSYKDKIDNIEAVCLFPKDFEASRRFYEDVFGFRPKRIQNDGVDPTVENPNFIEYKFQGATFALWSRDAVADIMGEDHLKQPVMPHNPAAFAQPAPVYPPMQQPQAAPEAQQSPMYNLRTPPRQPARERTPMNADRLWSVFLFGVFF